MTDNIQLKGLVQEFFEANPQKKEVFATSDEFLFTEKKYALDHAGTLPDSERVVNTYANPFLNQGDANEVPTSTNEFSEVEKKLLSTELIKSNYEVLKSLVKELQLETADLKAETLIKALEEYKQNLSK